ncbi:acid phosphatase [Leifsonia xyli subsp. xyli str. CTCB07]|uniref:Acid phosphatase n=1 Tax=Leifsonia xyli subsp. xyli (strain CTCB07) TaxID=281090 RepID=Q6ACH8_LEIXX|nr:acid phosphatase [Leifsonia xyli subsp. xyli str. CTCB07]
MTSLSVTLFVATFFGLLLIGLVISPSASWTADEMRFVIAANNAHTAVSDMIAGTIEVVFGPTGAVLIGLATVGLIGAAKRSWFVALQVALLIGIPSAAMGLMKLLVCRLGPDPSMLTYPPSGANGAPMFSYPSGHTAFAAAWALALLVVLDRRRLRGALFFVALGLVVVTGWSRLYLGVHYGTDVLASMVLVPVTTLAVASVTARLRMSHRVPSTRSA